MERAPQSPVVTAPGLTAPQSKCNGEACRWHKYKPDSCVVPKYAGSEEKDVDAWVAHFGDKTVHKIGKCIGNVRDMCRVTACRTTANRFFHVQCLKYQQSVYGTYRAWAAEVSPTAPGRAMRELKEFFLIEESDEKRQS